MTPIKLNRREVMVGAGAALLTARSAFAQAEPPKPAQIVVNHSGGSMGTAMRKAFFNGFEKNTASASSRRARPISASCAPWSTPATSNGT